MWLTRLIWISHVMNTTDMGFARDKHDWYGEISSALVFANAHMLVLEVRVQYTINHNIQYIDTVIDIILRLSVLRYIDILVYCPSSNWQSASHLSPPAKLLNVVSTQIYNKNTSVGFKILCESSPSRDDGWICSWPGVLRVAPQMTVLYCITIQERTSKGLFICMWAWLGTSLADCSGRKVHKIDLI